MPYDPPTEAVTECSFAVRNGRPGVAMEFKDESEEPIAAVFIQAQYIPGLIQFLQEVCLRVYGTPEAN